MTWNDTIWILLYYVLTSNLYLEIVDKEIMWMEAQNIS